MEARFEWPPLAEPKLLDRLALGDDDFTAFFDRFAKLIGPREFSDAALADALAYPWERPPKSFLLRDEQATPLANLPADKRIALATGRDGAGADSPARYPLLAFGSNAAPDRLAGKLAQLPADHRDAAVISGELHGFDVGVSAHTAIYGAMPATIFASPGTAVRASVLWLTLEQLTALAWTEVSYHLGRLDGIEFVPDIDAPAIGGVLAFVSRVGAHSLEGKIVAMQAIEARNRSTVALTQQELLERLAREAFGRNAGPAEVVRSLFDDYALASKRFREILSAGAAPFESAHWTRFGG